MFPTTSIAQPEEVLRFPQTEQPALGQPSIPLQPETSPEEIQLQEEEAARIKEDEEQELANIVRELIRKAEDEDLQYRYNIINIAKRNELYFNNIQNIVLDNVAHDYRTIDAILFELQKQGNVIDIKTNNIYRAFAESIIAAMSVELPPVAFPPDDSENPEDVETSEAYTKMSVVIQRHNNAAVMLIKALTILYNQGVVFGLTDYKEDPAYGEIETPVGPSVSKKITLVDAVCPECGENIESGLPSNVLLEKAKVSCENCGWYGAPVGIPREDYVDEVTEYEKTPKGRSFFDFYGCTFVKVPIYGRNQDSIGYLILREEDNIYKFREKYDDNDLSDVSDSQSYERWGRLPIDYKGNLPQDIATERQCWFRPWYYRLLDDEQSLLLKEKYPTGLKATIIGETVVDIKSEKLDDRWTISFDPRSNFIHAEAAGNVMIPIQDAENDIFNLGIQCIEFGIPETFADPRTLNLQKYSENPNAPGMMTAALPPRPDKGLSDGFHTVKTATLSNEYSTFDASLTSKAQFATGGFPSLYGGSNQKGSQTASEYAQSRAQALQRLQIPWRMIKDFWGKVIYKSVRLYAENLKEDESYPEKSNGKYRSVWIRKSSLTGKVGQIEPEMSEQIPQSWASKKEFITHLIELNIPEVGAILLHPNNSELLKQYASLPELYIPGEHDRNKQYAEYYRLAEQEPLDESTPSINVDVDVDDHSAEAAVLKNILVGSLGLALKLEKPLSYQNCILHYRQHILALQAKTMAPSGGQDVPPPTFAQSKE